MTSRLMLMLSKNVYESIPTKCKSKGVKSGTFIADLDHDSDEITQARYKYLVNICSEKPCPFFIPDNINLLERCCMMFSFENYTLLDKISFSHEILGASSSVGDDKVLFINIKESELKERYKYETRGMSFKNVFVQALTVREQAILCLHMIKVYNETKCEDLRRLKVQAYLDRLFFPKNETNFYIWRILEFYNSLINLKFRELEIIRSKSFFLDPNIAFSIPIILRRDIDIQLAKVYFSYGFFEKARSHYEFYLCYELEIECLIRLRKNELAVTKIKNQIAKLSKFHTFSQRAQYSDYCMKLATLLDDVKYYDSAFESYKSYEPLYAKAIYLFKKKEYTRSLKELEKALILAPENEKILFSYACVLTELREYKKAVDVYEKLVKKSSDNIEYHKNLALCYLYLEDLEKCLKNLKRVAFLDPTSMELYFQLSLRNNIKSEILWCFTKLDYLESTKEKIDLVLSLNLIDKESLRETVTLNPKLRNYLKELF